MPTLVVFLLLGVFVEWWLGTLRWLCFLSPLFIFPTRNRKFRIMLKIIGAMGIGTGISLLLTMNVPQELTYVKLFVVFQILMIAMVIYSIHQQYSIYKRCSKKCEWKGDWVSCPGMRGLNQRLISLGFKPITMRENPPKNENKCSEHKNGRLTNDMPGQPGIISRLYNFSNLMRNWGRAYPK